METLHVEARTKLLLSELGELETQVQAMRTEIATLDADYSEYRKSQCSLARRRAVGDEHESFVCADGRKFEKVTVRSIDAVGMLIRHRNGSTRIPYQVLPDSFQERFQWDAQDAENLLAKEEAAHEVRQRLMAIAYTKMAERRKEAAAKARIDEVRRMETRRLLAQRAQTQSPVSLAASGVLNSGRLGERRSIGSRSSGSYSYRRGSGSSRTRVYYRSRSSCYTKTRPSCGTKTPTSPRPSSGGG